MRQTGYVPDEDDRLCAICETWCSIYDTTLAPSPSGVDVRVCGLCALTLLRAAYKALTERQKRAVWREARAERDKTPTTTAGYLVPYAAKHPGSFHQRLKQEGD